MTGDLIFNQILELKVPREVESVYSSEPVLDWDNPEWKEIPFRVSVQFGATSEGDDDRPQVSTSYVLITPPGTDIPELSAASVVRVGGVMELEVVGEPARWPDPWEAGKVHHVEAYLEVVRG